MDKELYIAVINATFLKRNYQKTAALFEILLTSKYSTFKIHYLSGDTNYFYLLLNLSNGDPIYHSRIVYHSAGPARHN